MKTRRNSGRIGVGTVVGLVSLLAIAGLIALLVPRRPASRPGQTLLVYCAAGVQPPVEAIARRYQEESGVSVQLQYGGSGTLLSNLRVASAGDLFVAGDASFVRLGREQGVLAESLPLAQLHPVIAVRRGNPKQVRSVADLLRDDVRVALANPEAASVGKLTRRLLEPGGTWAALEPRVKVFKPVVTDVANDIRLGTVDAGIVWDATVLQHPDLEAVTAEPLSAATETVTVAVLSACRQPAAALRFARYLAAPERGGAVFAEHAFKAAGGDAWAETPEFVLFSGAMLRPALQETLKAFEAREGVRISTVYNGCGILTAQMRAGERPDAYFACDTAFMTSVADLYLDPVDVVDNQLMLIVPKGNPLGLRSPEDLRRPGLRVGLPHHEKSAMGNIAWKMLVALGVYDTLGANLKVESPTGDFLINQIRTGSLDVIIACRSNLAGLGEFLEGIPIDHALAQMTQPYAVGKGTRYPQTMTRLLDAILAADSRRRFEETGFRWRHAGP